MELQEISEKLNAAAAAGEFEVAVELANQYRRRFDEIWAAMPGKARKVSHLPEQALVSHRQAIGSLVNARAAKAAELQSVTAARPYGRRGPIRDAWCMTL
jgi:hypothetical protein